MDTSPSAIAKAFDAPMRFDKVLQAALSNNIEWCAAVKKIIVVGASHKTVYVCWIFKKRAHGGVDVQHHADALSLLAIQLGWSISGGDSVQSVAGNAQYFLNLAPGGFSTLEDCNGRTQANHVALVLAWQVIFLRNHLHAALYVSYLNTDRNTPRLLRKHSLLSA